jgi:NADH-quinone oxidoreductase subunit K
MAAATLVPVAVAGTLFALGLACLAARSSLIKLVIGLELLGKGASLLFIAGGYLAGETGVSQAVVFTLIVIEAVVAAVGLAFVILAKRTWGTLDAAMIRVRLRGGAS